MWTIHIVKNTAEISETCAQDLFDLQEEFNEEIWYDIGEVTYQGKLQFNSDHYEHMDFLGADDRYCNVLRAHNVSGDICFADLEQGGPSGRFWGYRFDGEGNLESLTGSVDWEVSTT